VICSGMAPQMRQSMSWLRRLRRPRPARGDQPTTGRGLLLHAVRHLHPCGGGLRGCGDMLRGGSGHANSSIHTIWSVRT
jgi:hypothetical protein